MTTSCESSSDRLRELNALLREAATEQFLSICSSRRWAGCIADAAGHRPQEVLSESTRRLDNSPEEELRGAEEHRRITRLRLERMIG
jgi:phytoene/squalene synthetase